MTWYENVRDVASADGLEMIRFLHASNQLPDYVKWEGQELSELFRAGDARH